MMSSNHAAILNAKGARLAVEERGRPQPGPDDVLIQVKAVAVNPLDWKVQEYDLFNPPHPTILGSDVAGEVFELGANVHHLQKGDRVAGLTGGLGLQDNNYGGFQEYAVVRGFNAIRLPGGMSFEAGAVLPSEIATAGLSIFKVLGVRRAAAGQRVAGPHEAFFIWGASSAMGSAAVQMAKALGFAVYVTASQGHHATLQALGADYCFDYRAADVLAEVVAAVKRNGHHINRAFDPIAEGPTIPNSAHILSEVRDGPAVLCVTLPTAEGAQFPEHVDVQMVQAFEVLAKEHEALARFLFAEWTPAALEQGGFKSHPPVQMEGEGLGAVQHAMDVVKKGVSGKKVVVRVG